MEGEAMMNKVKKAGFVSVLMLSFWGGNLESQAMSLDNDGPAKLSDIQKLLDVGEYKKAIPDLQKVLDMDAKDPDAWNMLGFAYRKSEALDLAWDAYERALTLDPDHIGANEYLGHLYIAQGNLERANAQLEKLIVLCPKGCEALDSLQAALK